MLRNFTYTSLIVVGTASSAFAGSLAEPVITPAPVMVAQVPMVVASDWTGFYIGGGVGLGNVDVGTDPTIDTNDLSVHAGYLYDMGSTAIGGELEYERIDFKDTGDDYDASVLRLKGIVGYDAGAFLPYITVGGAQLSLEDGSGAEDTGYFYGAGAQYAVSDNFRLGAEILQHEFENFDDGGADISAQTISLRVSYQF